MKYTNIFGIVTLCTINCMSIGKIGYLVPLENHHFNQEVQFLSRKF